MASYVFIPVSSLLADFSDTASLALAQKYRRLRLHALKTSPEAFASTYEIEVKRDIDQTIRRLKNPKAVSFIALDRASSSRSLVDREWKGMITLLGPEDASTTSMVSAQSDPFARMTNDASPLDENLGCQELHYHLNGIFVDAFARRAGLGRALIGAALSGADEQARERGVRCIHFTILVDSENDAARILYEKAGFEAVGRESYMQQPRSLLEGESESRERVAIQMELLKNKSRE